MKSQDNPIQLPEVTKEANDALRAAADRLSIAFRQDDNLLFLGDLEKREIKSVVCDLISSKNTHYDFIISAHHGTHWDNSLLDLKCDLCMASVGSTLQTYVNYNYLKMCDRFVRTDEWGDIRIKRKNQIK